jgi:hypothetical protein
LPVSSSLISALCQFWHFSRPALCPNWCKTQRLFRLNLTEKLKRKMGAVWWQKEGFNMADVMQMI